MPTDEQLETAEARRTVVLQTIRESINSRQYPPTISELMEATGGTVTKKTIRNDLVMLQRDGMIEIDPGVQRGIRLL